MRSWPLPMWFTWHLQCLIVGLSCGRMSTQVRLNSCLAVFCSNANDTRSRNRRLKTGVGWSKNFLHRRTCMCGWCWWWLCPGTVVYCVDAVKRDVLVHINLIDSLPSSWLSAVHCSHDKLKGSLDFFIVYARFSQCWICSGHSLLWHRWAHHQSYSTSVSVNTGIGDRLWMGKPPYVTSHPGQLSLLPSEGWEMSTGQSAMMICGWGVKAGWLISFVDAHMGGR